MSKSGIKEVWRRHFPDVLTSDDAIRQQCEFVFIDGAMTLNAFTHNDFKRKDSAAPANAIPHKSGRDLIEYILWPVRRHFYSNSSTNRTGTQARWIFISHDVGSNVPIAKGVVQASRKQAMRKIQPLMFSATHQQTLIELDRPVPNWNELRANPQAKAQAIRDIKRLISTTFVPPPDSQHYLVLDGEFGHEGSPRVLYTSPSGQEGGDVDYEVKTFEVPSWPCSHGESDLRLPGIIKGVLDNIRELEGQMLSNASDTKPAPHKILAYFSDTDIPCIALVQTFESLLDWDKTLANMNSITSAGDFHKLATSSLVGINNHEYIAKGMISSSKKSEEPSSPLLEFKTNLYIRAGDVMIDKATSTYICSNASKRKPNTATTKTVVEYVDVTRLVRELFRRFIEACDDDLLALFSTTTEKDKNVRILSAFVNFVASVGIVGFVGGGDYNNKYNAITPELLVETYLENFAKIGPLCIHNYSPPQQQKTSPIPLLQVIADRTSAPTLRLDNNKKAEANGVEFKHVDEDQTFTPEQHDEIKNKMCKLFTPIDSYIRLLFFAYSRKYRYDTCPSWAALRAYVTQHTPKSPQNRIPDALEIMYKFWRFQWQCYYWGMGHTFNFQPLPESLFGYKADKETMPMSKSNIAFRESSDAAAILSSVKDKRKATAAAKKATTLTQSQEQQQSQTEEVDEGDEDENATDNGYHLSTRKAPETGEEGDGWLNEDKQEADDDDPIYHVTLDKLRQEVSQKTKKAKTFNAPIVVD